MGPAGDHVKGNEPGRERQCFALWILKRRLIEMTKTPDSLSLELTIPGSVGDHRIAPECVLSFFSLVLCNN